MAKIGGWCWTLNRPTLPFSRKVVDMPTKSDRILSYLPGTFRRSPERSVLFAIVDAFGSELQKGENSLAAIMQSHWVDHADRGADVIDDLARMASLYGLQPRCRETENSGALCALPPRCDETVEEFREHLKRYVLTFLEGTVTVQGLLRVAAENLGLHIADDYEEMDTWWDRSHDELVTIHAHADDAAAYLLGFREATAVGRDALPARVQGTVDLSGEIDLGDPAVLRLQIDDGNPVDIDLLAGASDPTAVTLGWIIVAINVALEQQIATHDGRYLTLATKTSGPDSRLEIMPVEGDASERLLGLTPRAYSGADGLAAIARGTQDLSQGIDLSERSLILLGLDGATPVLIDCKGIDPANTRPGEIASAINKEFKTTIARTDGNRITLFSPTVGPEGTILFARLPSGDASEIIFGIGPHLYTGTPPLPARISGKIDLGDNLNFMAQHRLHLVIDGQRTDLDLRAIAINPRKVSPDLLADLINTRLGGTVATIEDRRLVFTTLSKGSASSLSVDPMEVTRRRRFVTRAKIVDEAAQAVLGFVDKEAQGKAATKAQLAGEKDLSRGVDLTQRRFLRLAIDSGPVMEIDCAGSRPQATLPKDIVSQINSHFDLPVARSDGKYLILESSTIGSASRIELMAPDNPQSDATKLLFGPVDAVTEGKDPTPAIITGKVDMLSPVDLSERSLLRVAISGQRPINIDIAGAFPDSTSLDEIIEAINAKVPGLASANDNRHLQLSAPSGEEESHLALLPLRYLEVIEYLPEREKSPTEKVRHGDSLAVVNGSAAEAFAEISINSRSGMGGPGLVNSTLNWQLRLMNALSAGEKLRLYHDLQRGIAAQIVNRVGKTRDVPGNEILVGPLGTQAVIPFEGDSPLSGNGSQPPSLQLNNPSGPWLLRLRARVMEPASRAVSVSVTDSSAGPDLFDVSLNQEKAGEEPFVESYPGVTIGQDPNRPGALTWELNAGPERSSLVTAELYKKEMVLNLPQGRVEWIYLDCHTDRFDDPEARFDEAHFAGGTCREPGIFDISRFAHVPDKLAPDNVVAVFAGAAPDGPQTEVSSAWTAHRPGTVQVNLPLDLPARFGGRFNEARFGQGMDSAEQYAGVVVEPEDDPDHMIKRITANKNSLVTANKVDFVELGWEAVELPFRQPQFLSLGREARKARLYLTGEGINGFIRICAREPGAWCNEIAISVRLTGPATYDVCVIYRGGVYENAIAAVAGDPAPVLVQEMLDASPVGVLQAKAAGVHASVTRDKEGILTEEIISKE
jgi:hypothetical protein